VLRGGGKGLKVEVEGGNEFWARFLVESGFISRKEAGWQLSAGLAGAIMSAGCKVSHGLPGRRSWFAEVGFGVGYMVL